MKKLIFLVLSVCLLSVSLTSNAQLVDEKNVTITMDLQPILQLNMTTPDHIDFVFDDIREYYAGITKYGATVLKVSSTVRWDLWAVGMSTSTLGGGTIWDNQVNYDGGAGFGATVNVPISALELHQYAANSYTGAAAGSWADYSKTFQSLTTLTTGRNSIYVGGATPYNGPAATEKYIQGHKGTADATMGAPAGSYLTTTVTAGSFSSYYFAIDYRIVPGLPATFPTAGTNAGVSSALTGNSYAKPGVYTMDVKYILAEDQ